LIKLDEDMDNLSLKKIPLYRFYEMLPGIVIWSIFALALFFTFFKPLFAVYFIIIFAFYWFIKSVYMVALLSYSWRRYKKAIEINWFQKVKEIKGWEDHFHLFFLPTYKEGIEIVRPTFEALVKSNYPKDKFIIALCGEERDKENFLNIAQQIEKEFAHYFFKFFVFVHPKNLKGEIPGKGSSTHFAGKEVKKIIDKLGLPYEKIIVSDFDIDTCVHREYLAHLTYKYLTVENPTRCSYQPVAVFNNNVWQSPAFTRVVARCTTFWLLTELSKSHLYFTFSSHSMSFKALVDVGFWEKDVVTEDSRIFIQCFLYYNGDYQVVPLYTPVSMDTVYAGSFLKTIVNQYKQILRWGYGVENVPYMLWYFPKNKKIPFLEKLKPLFTQFEGSCSWATVPILLILLGNVPVFIAHSKGVKAAVVYNAPFTLSWLMTLAMVGLFTMAVVSTLLLPSKPEKRHYLGYLGMTLQWILFPITMIAFGSVPAAEGITRLMIGKYLGFRTTEKSR